jgi:hypothetical protein
MEKRRQNRHVSEFPLEKTTLNLRITPVLNALKQLCHRPALRFGLARDVRGRLRDPRFVSFLSQGDRKLLNTDFHDAVLRGRKFARRAFVAALALGGAWIVLESARALSVF